MMQKLKTAVFLVAIATIGWYLAHSMFHIPRRTVLVGIFSALLFLPVLKRPGLGLYAIFVLLPFIPFIRRLYYLVYERPNFDPLLVVGEALLMIMLLGLFFEFKERRAVDRQTALFNMLVGVYLGFLLLRVFLANNLPVGHAIAKFKNYGPAVLFFYIGSIYAGQRSQIKHIWYITVAIGVLGALYGIKQLYVGYIDAEQMWFSSISFTTLFIAGIARPFSFFASPVAFADYMQISIIAVLLCHGWARGVHRHILLILTPLFFYAILITSVRSNWIGAIVSFFLWFVFVRISGMKKRMAVLVLTVVVFFGYQAVSETVSSGVGFGVLGKLISGVTPQSEVTEMFIAGRTSAIENPFEEHSFLSRLALWNYLFRLTGLPENAILGRGLGSMNADSLYMTYLAEFGYPGMVFIIGLIIAFIWKGLKTTDSAGNRETMMLARAITAFNIVFAVMGITGTHIHYFPGDIYFWFFNGVLIRLPEVDVLYRTEPENDDNPGNA